jgi:hypothetical protein
VTEAELVHRFLLAAIALLLLAMAFNEAWRWFSKRRK